jgi:RimJ/RimL family protein N-acetyltransferase
MEWFPKTLTPAESDALADEYQQHIAEQGWGLWAVQISGGADFIGFVGLCATDDTVPTYPAIEVAWCLAAAHWGQGYAPEAAARDHGFLPRVDYENSPGR